MTIASRKLAAIDIGTNSFHLVVADVKNDGKFKVLGREKEVVRLGEGFSDMKHLGEPAMLRAIDVLKRFSQIIAHHGAAARAVATSAVREALNRDEFVARVRSEIGFEVEVVSGFEEARLIYLGVLQALPVYQRKILLLDIGGGSTEFLVGKCGQVSYVNSLKLGAVRLTHRFFEGGAVKQKKIDECRTFLQGELIPIRRALRDAGVEQVAGSSGTIHNAAAMVAAMQGREQPSADGGVEFTKKDLDRAIRRLLEARSLEERRQIPGMDPARADIAVAGMLILEQIFEQLELDRLVTSRYALREGIILDTIRKIAGEDRVTDRLKDIRKSSVFQLAESCRYEARHATNVTRMALAMFDELRPLHKLGHTERELLEAAAILHDIGYHISHAQHHIHSWYIVRNAELLGYTEKEKDMIANMTRYHRKSHPKEKHENLLHLNGSDIETIKKLAAILRIADGLDRRHQGMFRKISCEKQGRNMLIRLVTARTSDCSLEIWGAERRKELFQEVFGLQAVFSVEREA
jgi:exopolyphosphatase / guanosine-5'-triphosphate,3'-diphosphate pyrophosphatase